MVLQLNCRLAAMTELQREFLLAERADKRNAELLRQKLLKKVGCVIQLHVPGCVLGSQAVGNACQAV